MRVETVRGAMAVDGLGATLMHEHVFVLTPDVMQNYGHDLDGPELMTEMLVNDIREGIAITDDVLPPLREHGLDEAQVTAMLVHNLARYFTGGQE